MEAKRERERFDVTPPPPLQGAPSVQFKEAPEDAYTEAVEREGAAAGASCQPLRQAGRSARCSRVGGAARREDCAAHRGCSPSGRLASPRT
jgi:hypothetical protein